MFADTGIRVSVSLVLCSQHGRGQRPKEKEKNQSWTRTDGPQNLPVTSSSLYGDQRVDSSRPSAHTLIFFPLLGASTIIVVPIDSIIDHPSVHDDDGDTRCGQSGSATRWVRSRVSRKPVDERYPVSIATFLRDIVPKNRYRAATKFRDATTRRRIIGSMDGYTRHLRLIFFDVFRDGIFMISRAMNICTGFLSWDSDSLTDLRAPCLFFFFTLHRWMRESSIGNSILIIILEVFEYWRL